MCVREEETPVPSAWCTWGKLLETKIIIVLSVDHTQNGKLDIPNDYGALIQEQEYIESIAWYEIGYKKTIKYL